MVVSDLPVDELDNVIGKPDGDLLTHLEDGTDLGFAALPASVRSFTGSRLGEPKLGTSGASQSQG